MNFIRYYFSALLSKIEPSSERKKIAKEYPAKVRDFLKKNEFETAAPHTRLSGSYRRSTAILDIHDVDVLLFVPESRCEDTPNALLIAAKKALDAYPSSQVEVSSQRRSVRLKFEDPDFFLDIVPAVASDGLDEALLVPDRPSKEWIPSDPLGYAHSLSELNQDSYEKAVPLVKLMKAWRDSNFLNRRPKSYLLEVMVFHLINDRKIELEGQGYGAIVAQIFAFWEQEYANLVVPAVKDPKISENNLAKNWGRSYFETFMRRVKEASRASSEALEETNEERASELWAKIFKELWPSQSEAKAAALAEAASISPGSAGVGAGGSVLSKAPSVVSQPTRYYGVRD